MLSLVICFLAVVSTTALIALWFWEVRRKLRVHYSVVVSARGQMETFERRAAATATGDKDVTAAAAAASTGKPPKTTTPCCGIRCSASPVI